MYTYIQMYTYIYIYVYQSTPTHPTICLCSAIHQTVRTADDSPSHQSDLHQSCSQPAQQKRRLARILPAHLSRHDKQMREQLPFSLVCWQHIFALLLRVTLLEPHLAQWCMFLVGPRPRQNIAYALLVRCHRYAAHGELLPFDSYFKAGVWINWQERRQNNRRRTKKTPGYEQSTKNQKMSFHSEQCGQKQSNNTV